MSSSDLIILAYPVIGAVAMAVACVGALIFLGYHKSTASPTAERESSTMLPEQSDPARLLDHVLRSLSEAELSYVAERSAKLASRAKLQREASEA